MGSGVSKLLTCLAVLASSLCAQSTPICAPSADVKSALDQLPREQTANQSRYEFIQARRSAIRSLMQRYPGNVFVQREYVGFMANSDIPADRLKVIAEYQALHDQRPGDAYISYLYGTTLLGKDTQQAIQLFTDTLAMAPLFPWPHLQFVSIYSTPNFLDKPKAVAHTRAFLSACPAALEGYAPVGGLGDMDLTRQAVTQLREIIRTRTDPEALGAYSTLWPLEFAAHPPSEYDALRKQVAADLAHLRGLNLENVRQWWSALEEGYKLTNEEKQSDWAADQSARRFPSNSNLPERTRWYEGHAYPGGDAPVDKTKAYYSDLLKETDAWVRQRPNSYVIWFDRLRALESLDDSAPSDLETCAAKMLAIAHADKGPEPLDAVTDYQLAIALYSKRANARLQLELAQKGREQTAAEYMQPDDDRYVSKKRMESRSFWSTDLKFSGYFYEADAYVRLKEAGKAREALTQAGAALRALKLQVNDEFRKTYASQESNYWLGEARLSELQGQPIDAMAYYQSALIARLDSGSVPAPGEKDALAQDAHRLWASLGGSEEGWKLWYTRRAGTIAAQSHLTWENTREPLPAFRLADLQGKLWQSADLRGKVVFLNFWASY